MSDRPGPSHASGPDLPDDATGPVTRLLIAYRAGDEAVFDELFHHVYADLRQIAEMRLRGGRGGATMNPTALVHECYLRLINQTAASFRDRAHFMAVASKAMRHILIDYARRKSADKRGGELHRVTLKEPADSEAFRIEQLLTVETLLEDLARHDERLVEIIECRFFGGMTMPETAEALGLGQRTVERGWTKARARLYLALNDGKGP